MVSPISSTLPVPSSQTMRSLSMTMRVASRWRSILPVRHCLAQVMQDLSVCLGYLFITVSSPSMRVKASASDPANPQYMLSDSFRIFRPSTFTLVFPWLTCPSPIITVYPLRFRARIVVWCHYLLVEKWDRRGITLFANIINNLLIFLTALQNGQQTKQIMRINTNVVLFLSWVIAIMIDECAGQTGGVPMQTTKYPFPGFTRIMTTITMPTVGQIFPSSLNVTITFPTALLGTPTVLAAIGELAWIGYLTFDFLPFGITTTGCTLILANYPKTDPTDHRITLLKFVVGVFDPTYYTSTTTNFEYIQPSSSFVSQAITITNYQLHTYPILVAYQDYYDPLIFTNIMSTPTVIYTLPNPPSPMGFNLNTWTTLSSNGYMIKHIRYQLTTINPVFVKLSSYYTIFTAIAIGLQATSFSLANNEASNSQNHFYGLTALYNIRSEHATSTISIMPLTQNNAQLYFITNTLYIYRCPLNAPYYVDPVYRCFPACPSNYYIIPESSLGNPFYRCGACSNDCLTCTGASANCTACATDFRLSAMDPVTLMKTCLCPQGQYGLISNCLNCNATIPYCIDCTTSSSCLSCDESLVYNPVANICECPPNTTPKITTLTYTLNGVPFLVNKLMCFNTIFRETCNTGIDGTVVPEAISGFVSFGLTCQCLLGGSLLNGICS